MCRELKCLLTYISAQKKKSRAAAKYFQSQTQTGTVSFITVDENTRFLSTVMRVNKAFQIPYMIQVGGECKQKLNCSQIQADQRSDINVILTVITKWLELSFHSLSDVNFADLIMKTADYKEILLHY